MKCLILAAGYATRLYPLTENFPKPLLKVGEKTILDWLLDDLRSSGLAEDFVVISNHRFAGHFREWAPSDVLVLDDGTSTNETRLGAVRDAQFAIDSLGLDEDLFVMAGDNLLDFSLRHFLSYARLRKTSCIMRYHEADPQRLRKSGVVETDAQDRILNMEEKPAEPRSHWCCPPFYYLVREDVRRVPDAIAAGCGTDAPGSFISWLSQQTAVHAMVMPGRRFDIGNLSSYKQVCESYKGIAEI